jgi:hypothetical protein
MPYDRQARGLGRNTHAAKRPLRVTLYVRLSSWTPGMPSRSLMPGTSASMAEVAPLHRAQGQVDGGVPGAWPVSSSLTPGFPIYRTAGVTR